MAARKTKLNNFQSRK